MDSAEPFAVTSTAELESKVTFTVTGGCPAAAAALAALPPCHRAVTRHGEPEPGSLAAGLCSTAAA